MAVSVLHTGRHYADELSDEALTYHYPRTKLPRRDQREVRALKNAAALELPIFTVLPSEGSTGRRVKWGYVLDWDDQAEEFLIGFGSEPEDPQYPDQETPFRLKADRRERQRSRTERERSPRFRFEVMSLYGWQCAFCSISEPRLLEAAHIRPVSQSGSDDPRNGLPACANHHLALDKGLITIKPDTYEIVVVDPEIALQSLGVEKMHIRSQKTVPHTEAINWHWNNNKPTSSND